jgi:hypothetical protein
MRRTAVLVACVLAVAALFALAMPAIAGAASAFATNADCLKCHDQATGVGAISKVNFSVPADPTSGTSVDYGKCRACHWLDPATRTHGWFSHSLHVVGVVYPSGYEWGGPNCTRCHPVDAVGTGDVTLLMTTLTPDGWFATDSPRAVSADRMHALHVNGSWPRAVNYTSGCASCHSPASCTACHVTPAVSHGDHTWNAASMAYVNPPEQYVVGYGTPVTNPDLATAVSTTVTCTNSACHSRLAAGTPAFTPTCASCHPLKTSEHGYTTAAHAASIETSKEPGTAVACTACHSTDLMTEHGKTTSNGPRSCATCHPKPYDLSNRPFVWNKDCDQCHGVDTTPAKHGGMAAKHSTSGSAGCAGTPGCHDVSNVAALHSKAATVAPSGAPIADCLVCHVPGGAGPASAECGTCHTAEGVDYHRRLLAAHTVAASGDCIACHEKPDVRGLHAASPLGACAVCHTNPSRVAALPSTAECVNCHGSLSPPDQKHYVETSHTAGAEAVSDCGRCHYLSMKTEHDKPTVSPKVTCVSCHEGKVDLFTAVWNGTCGACHSTRHVDMATKHTSANTTCAGTGCHNVADVAALHSTSLSGCAVCHKGPATPATTTDCSAAGCHAGIGTSHHEAHNASAVIDAGCRGCHFTYLDDEHAALGYSCATCHKSTNAAVKAAIVGHQRVCSACHPAVNGRNRHAAQSTTEFIKGNQSGHRVYSALPSPRTSFYINGAIRTWALPADASYLKTGWGSASVVTCDGCHTFASTATGPHGASVTVNRDPAYPTDWKTVYLGSSGSHTSSTSGASSDTFICAKCHTDFGSMNAVHSDSNHSGSTDGRCIGCHTKVPHGWRLPRLLAYTNDPAPYASLNLTGISVKNRTPTSGWSVSDCSQSGCGEHSSSMSNRWPSTTLAYGTITGVVKDVGGLAVAAATVTNDRGQSTTTDATGTYTFVSVPAGTTAVNVTVAKAGYITQAKPAATILADGQTVTLDFTLATLGSIAGVVTDASTQLPLAGVTVSFTGATTLTDSNGAYSFANLAAGSRTLSFVKTGYTTQTTSVMVANDNTVIANAALVPWPNLALSKTWTASRYQSATYTPAKAGDANLTTYWWSNSAGGSTTSEWLTVDLGSSLAVSKVEVAWLGALFAHEFRISTSTDNSHWSSAYSSTSGVTGSVLCTFSSRNARYIRLECNRTSGSNTGYGVAEMRVFQ